MNNIDNLAIGLAELLEVVDKIKVELAELKNRLNQYEQPINPIDMNDCKHNQNPITYKCDHCGEYVDSELNVIKQPKE